MVSRTTDRVRVIELSLRLLNHTDDVVRRHTWSLLSELYGQETVIYLRRVCEYGLGEMQSLARAALSGLNQLRVDVPFQTKRSLHISCMGAFRVRVGTRELQASDWASGNGSSRGGGLKAQKMLAYLLHCGPTGATEDELISVIWGADSPNTTSFARTQTHLFDVLDGDTRQHGQCHFITKHKRHLVLRPELCSSDAEHFLQWWHLAQQTEHDDSLASAASLYEAVVQQYNGWYMDTIATGAEWHLERATNLQSLCLAALERLVTHEYISGNHDRCRSICQQALRLDCGDQVWTEKLLVVLADLDLPGEAARAFNYYLTATGLQPHSHEYTKDPVVQTYWHYWPKTPQ